MPFVLITRVCFSFVFPSCVHQLGRSLIVILHIKVQIEYHSLIDSLNHCYCSRTTTNEKFKLGMVVPLNLKVCQKGLSQQTSNLSKFQVIGLKFISLIEQIILSNISSSSISLYAHNFTRAFNRKN